MSERVSFPSIYVDDVLIDHILDTMSYSLLDTQTFECRIKFQSYNTVDILRNVISWYTGSHSIRLDFNNVMEQPILLLFSQCTLTSGESQLGPSGRVICEFKGFLIS